METGQDRIVVAVGAAAEKAAALLGAAHRVLGNCLDGSGLRG